MFAVLLVVGVISIFKSYPSLGDFALWHALLGTYSELSPRSYSPSSRPLLLTNQTPPPPYRPQPSPPPLLPHGLLPVPPPLLPPPLALLGVGERQLLLRVHPRLDYVSGRVVARRVRCLWEEGGAEGTGECGEGPGEEGRVGRFATVARRPQAAALRVESGRARGIPGGNLCTYQQSTSK